MKIKPFYRVALTVIRFLCFLLFRVRFVGLENLPTSGGYVVAPNHRSLIDPVFVAVGMKKTQLHPMAKEELMGVPVLGTLLKWLEVFPVSRGKGDQTAIIKAKEIIEAGQVLLLFPEGTRAKTQELLPPQSGVGLICAGTACDILPVGIYFNGKLRPFKKVTVRFGTLMPNTQFHYSNPIRSAERKAISREIMGEIQKLYEKGHEK